MQTSENKILGFTTADALKKLHDEISRVLQIYEKRKDIKFKSQYEILQTYSIFITVVVILGLIYTEFYITAFFVLLILVLNVLFVRREDELKRTEMIRKARLVLEDIQLAIYLSKDWKDINYPDLCSPLSPCISLVWTYRDNRLVNLPTALLVEGDIIVLRLGSTSPGACHEINNNKNPKTFKLGDTYGFPTNSEPPSKPIAVQPLPDLVCEMQETPFLDNLKMSLENFLNRPQTNNDRMRHILVNHYMQRYIFFLTITLILSTVTLRAFDKYYIEGKIKNNTWDVVAVRNVVSAWISLIPLIFPLIWINLHHWGTAKLETLLTIPQPLMMTEKEKKGSPEIDTPTSGEFDLPKIPRKQIWVNYLRILMNGSCESLSRSTNIIQVLGSVSAFCCVDKKGVLSWPNPTPEKVFFLRDSTVDNKSINDDESTNSDITDHVNGGQATAEVLDVTHDQNSPFKLEFDDHEWKNHLASLKPLGLAILINTCGEKTHYSYSKFCGHITASSLIDKNLVPVTNRYEYDLCASFMHGRCLCELARQIGFVPQAKNIFNYEAQIASYRHLQPEVIRRDIRFTKSLQLASKIKIPFPHSLSVIVKENQGGLQLLSQGTADLILDCCDDFWSGKELRPLKEEERKRAQDFYQRNALTAYCTAFAYRPLRHSIAGPLSGAKSDDFMCNNDVAYLELPPETATRVSESNYNDFEGHSLTHSISSDSLLYIEAKEEKPVHDVDGCFEMQSHQIFIGMVTMQYQAQTDIVQLIEKFDKACIRFVHFSKENELRSRVFSEKMGLESGWNCHISLAPDDHSTLPSPKQSEQLDETPKLFEKENIEDEFTRLLPTNFVSTKMLSSSAPCQISKAPIAKTEDTENSSRKSSGSNHDSVMEELENDDVNNHSISQLTDSSEQSGAQMPFLQNIARLPRGISNIEPHIDNIDNVPLLVSLYTDCSPETTKEMLRIMQKHGEICVVMGSSANHHSNTRVFLQANCSIACEPLYPQICQSSPPFTESNLYNNKQNFLKQQPGRRHWLDNKKSVTISPIYLSRMLNSLPCSISVCRDDPISILSMFELARRFSIGLWNCVQFWSCAAVMFSIINLFSCAFSLPPILSPDICLYLMLFVVAPLAISLVRIEPNYDIMNRACGRKPSKNIDFNSFCLILWFYGFKFIISIATLLIVYFFTVDHVFDFVESGDERFVDDLKLAKHFVNFGVVIYLVTISASFVHREHSLWQKNPMTNGWWLLTSIIIVIIHSVTLFCGLYFNQYNSNAFSDKWPVLLLMLISTIIIAAFAELCKYQEIKHNKRCQRRARLDFGTKLGMNSPF